VLANLVIVASYHIDLDRQFWSLFLHDGNLLQRVTYRRRVDHRHIDVLNNRTKTVYGGIYFLTATGIKQKRNKQ
jgi:hypothetical protein